MSRVSETMTEAKATVQKDSKTWQQSADGTVHWFIRELTLLQGREQWVVVYTQATLQRAQQTLQRQVSKAQTISGTDALPVKPMHAPRPCES